MVAIGPTSAVRVALRTAGIGAAPSLLRHSTNAESCPIAVIPDARRVSGGATLPQVKPKARAPHENFHAL
jgi:hypothetical protein